MDDDVDAWQVVTIVELKHICNRELELQLLIKKNQQSSLTIKLWTKPISLVDRIRTSDTYESKVTMRFEEERAQTKHILQFSFVLLIISKKKYK